MFYKKPGDKEKKWVRKPKYLGWSTMWNRRVTRFRDCSWSTNEAIRVAETEGVNHGYFQGSYLSHVINVVDEVRSARSFWFDNTSVYKWGNSTVIRNCHFQLQVLVVDIVNGREHCLIGPVVSNAEHKVRSVAVRSCESLQYCTGGGALVHATNFDLNVTLTAKLDIK
jgi:hypothetical protein